VSIDSKRYPPGPLTGYSQTLNTFTYGNGLYTASASTENNPEYNAAYYAFNHQTHSYTWQSEENYVAGYQGTVTTTISGNSYKGDWLQIKMPNRIVLRHYVIVGSSSDGISSQGPRDFYIAGSNDGLIWVLVDSHTSIDPYARI
jgi:hypothetical protein